MRIGCNVFRSSGATYRIPILRRKLPRGAGTVLFYRCPWCGKPHRFLYLQTRSGDELVDYLGPRCRECAGLRFASQGRYRTKLTREFSPILGPRPRYPWAVSDPRIAERATQDRRPRGESPEVSDDPEDPDDIDLEDDDEATPPYPGRPRGPKVARPRPGADSDKFSDEARALVDRFFNGMQGRLSLPTKNGLRYESPIPYLKLALDWTLYVQNPHG